MCLAIPGKILELIESDPPLAHVEVLGVRRKVDLGLLDEADPGRPGDWVLIHVGFAMSKISPHYAQEQLDLLEALGEAEAAALEVRGYGLEESGAP
jgi:hydrogenase expression/formation protein HypC